MQHFFQNRVDLTFDLFPFREFFVMFDGQFDGFFSFSTNPLVSSSLPPLILNPKSPTNTLLRLKTFSYLLSLPSFAPCFFFSPPFHSAKLLAKISQFLCSPLFHQLSSLRRMTNSAQKGRAPSNSEDDEPIRLPALDNSALINRFRLTVIGRVFHTGGRTMEALLAFMPSAGIWDTEGRVRGFDLGNGRFHFNFETEEDL